MYFSDYGFLTWLEPQQYFAEPWRYLRSAEGEDGQMYDIVFQHDTEEVRYTNI